MNLAGRSIKRWAGLMALVLSAACTSNVPTAAPGWSVKTIGDRLDTPILRPAVTFEGETPIFAWVGKGAVTFQTGNNPPRAVPIGHVPQRLSLYPSSNGFQALWLDEGDLPDQTLLYTASFAPDLTLAHGPTAVSDTDTVQYAAVALTSGALDVLWTARVNTPAQPLFFQTVDNAGRPGSRQLIADNAAYPALALDANGAPTAAWLEPQPDAIWLVRFAQLPGDLSASSTPLSVSSTILGLIQPGANRALDSVAFGTDSTNGYFVWGDVSVTGAPDGHVFALTFPLAQPGAAKQISVAENARWADIPGRAPLSAVSHAPLPVGLTFSTETGDQAGVAWLNGEQVQGIDKLPSPDRAATIGMVRVAQSADGQTVMVWSALGADGNTTVYEAVRGQQS